MLLEVFPCDGPEARKGPVEYQMADAVRMECPIGDGGRAPVGDAEQGDFLKTDGVNHRFKVTDMYFRREVLNVTIGETRAAAIVAN
jgi:hypothetical protein